MADYQVMIFLILINIHHSCCWNSDFRNNEDNEISSSTLEDRHPQYAKLMSLLAPKSNQICPDHSQCSGGTCCLASKSPLKYNCCPREAAVCCPDGHHCCPSGYTCVSQSTRCQKKAVDEYMTKPIPEQLTSNSINDNQICPDKKQCNGTCCKMDQGYGCCQFPHAVCCSDKLSCCPENTVCNMASRRCEVKHGSVEYLSFRALESPAGGDLQSNQICPDHSECNGTCCKTRSGFGCCPYTHGTCCPDESTCCPDGFTCDVATKSCRPRDGVVENEVGLQQLAISSELSSNQMCPDHHTQCNGTCCKVAQGYGCCPLPHAVCCADQHHCCPEGSTCDLSTSTCRHREESFGNLFISESGLQELAVEKRTDEVSSNQMCPDHHTQCNGTCCKVAQGYGCCPLPHAVCCADQHHCCPEGSTCDLSTSTCRHREESFGNLVISESGLEELVVEKRTDEVSSNQQCPDHTQCNGTCCKVAQGYGCCPLPHAVCCADQRHCCPEGNTCDPSTSACRKRVESSGNLVIVESGLLELKIKKVLEVRSVEVCPDHRTQCNGSCCWTSGRYGCCPYTHAVCCSDHQHCCPQGSTCDLSTGSCRRREEAFGQSVIAESGFQELELPKASTVCPGGHFQCEGSETCCWNNITLKWSCCSVANGICCAMGEYCCPQGSECDVPHRRCINPSQMKIAATSAAFRIGGNDVVCPGGDACPDGSTCCLEVGGDYGCCNFKNAVCCSDKIHCCPSGTVCDLQRETCQRRGVDVEWKEVTGTSLVASTKQVPGGIVCPGAEVFCPDGMTCCPYGPGEYACCPLPNAECCQDQRHCCSEGMKCDPTGGTCSDKFNNKMPWVAKVPALHLNLRDSTCPDNSTCTDTQKCCQNPSAETYYCCPYVDGVCCKTKAKCCSKDHSCTDKGKCRHKKH